MNVKTAEIFPATFPVKGPDEDLRSAHTLTGAPVSKRGGENGEPAQGQWDIQSLRRRCSGGSLGLWSPFHSVFAGVAGGTQGWAGPGWGEQPWLPLQPPLFCSWPTSTMPRQNSSRLGLISGGLSHMWISGWNKMMHRFYRYLNELVWAFLPSSWVERGVLQYFRTLPSALLSLGGWGIPF